MEDAATFALRARSKINEFDRARNDDLYVFDAIARVETVYAHKCELDGDLPAAKWFDAEMAKFTTIADFMMEWGLEKGVAKVEDSRAKMKAAGKR